MLLNPLQLSPEVIVARPDERGDQAGALRWGSSKGSDKHMV